MLGGDASRREGWRVFIWDGLGVHTRSRGGCLNLILRREKTRVGRPRRYESFGMRQAQTVDVGVVQVIRAAPGYVYSSCLSQ